MKRHLVRKSGLISLVLTLIVTSGLILGAMSAGGRPVRIAVDPGSSSARAGTAVEVKIELRDASDHDAETPKDLYIELAVGLEGGGVRRQKVVINAGTDSTKVKVPFYAPGIYLLKASHPYLREGSAHVRVKPGGPAPSKPWNFNRLYPYSLPRPFMIPALFRTLPQALPSGPLEVQFHYADEGSKLIANGVEKCKIMAFLSEPAPFDIQLRMTSTLGSLTPNPIVIEKGEDEGTAELVSTNWGDINVQFIDSRPPHSIKVTRGEEKKIHFSPPITRVRLTPSPPKIIFGRTTNIEVELVDEQDVPTATENERSVSLLLEDGHGDFEPRSVRIASGAHNASALFTPSGTGKIKVSARTFGAGTKEPTVIHVSMPVLAMIFTVLGGLVGGIFAAARNQPVTKWKVVYSSLAGIAAAFLLYAACQNGLVPKLPPPATVNFFGAAMIGLIGGWLGTEMFNSILKMTGLPTRAG